MAYCLFSSHTNYYSSSSFFRQAPETSVQILQHEANEQNNETFQLCQISPDDMKIQLHTVKGDLGDIYSFFCKMFK